VLRLNISQEPQFLDPTQAQDSISINVLLSITHPLVYFNPELELVPGLADSWETSDDGLEITFHLGDHKYSNGEDIVADDFVYSWKRLADPRVASAYSYVLEPVQGWTTAYETDPADDAAVEAALDALGVAAPDPKTFVVTLERPASYFPYIAGLWLTAPEKESFTYDEADGYVSSGPMMLSEWEHGSHIVLEPNPHWNGDQVNLERIEMAMINDQAAALAAYENDELDVVPVPASDVARIRADEELSAQVVTGNRLSVSYYGYDLKDPSRPFARSPLLRKAFNEALDKELLINTVFGGVGLVAHSLVPPGMPGHQEDEFIPYDVDQAKADFEAALDELGMTLDELNAMNLQLGYNVAGSNEDQAVFFQEQWKTVFGVDVELVATEDFGTYLDILDENPYDIFRLGWGADYPHPNNFLTDLISCNSANNNMAYCNPEVDELLVQAAAEAELEDQLPLYNEAQEMVMADAPIIPQLYAQAFTLVKPWVQNFTPTAADSNSGQYFYYRIAIADH
jgi:oligopeptide transport system substrate-binding protein